MLAPFINDDLYKLISKLNMNNCNEVPDDITGTVKEIKEEEGKKICTIEPDADDDTIDTIHNFPVDDIEKKGDGDISEGDQVTIIGEIDECYHYLQDDVEKPNESNTTVSTNNADMKTIPVATPADMKTIPVATPVTETGNSSSAPLAPAQAAAMKLR